MKVTVSVNGRFHAFDLAKQLQKHGVLHRLVTSYPKFKAREWGIQGNRVQSLLPLEVLNRSRKYLSRGVRDRVSVFQKKCYDAAVAACLRKGSDIFVGWSGNSLHSIRRAKKLGMITVVERGSAHILSQQRLLREEYALAGVDYNPIPQAIVQKELDEYQEADFISIPSLFVKHSFLERGVNEHKLIHNPYGVDLNNFQQTEKDDSLFRIIYCGAITIQKGIRYLLQAFSELALPRAELWLIGAMHTEMELFFSQYGSENVFHKGPYPQGELPKYYSQGSLFCFPSIQDGFGMVIPQAMACGLPVICSANSGGADIVEEGKEGYIIPIRDVEALKEKILFLYEQRGTCLQMGKVARKRVQSGLSWDSYGDRMIREYRKICPGATDTSV